MRLPILSLAIAAVATLVGMPALAQDVSCDVDGNGGADLVTSNSTAARVQTWDGNAVTATGYISAGSGHWHQPICGDVDGNGTADLVWSGRSSAPAIRIDRLDGTNVVGQSFLPNGNGIFNTRFAADLDSDGRVELIEVSPVATKAGVRITKLDPTGQSVESRYYLGDGSGAFRLAAVGDLDGNGLGDLIWNGASAIRIDLNPLGTGQRVVLPVAMYSRVDGVGDLDGDGKDDLVIHTWAALRILLMDGGTILATGYLPHAGGMYEDSFLADLDADGRLDLIATGWITVLRIDLMAGVASTSRGWLNFPSDYDAGWWPSHAVDMSGDGKADILFDVRASRSIRLEVMDGITSVRSIRLPSGEFHLDGD